MEGALYYERVASVSNSAASAGGSNTRSTRTGSTPIAQMKPFEGAVVCTSEIQTVSSQVLKTLVAMRNSR